MPLAHRQHVSLPVLPPGSTIPRIIHQTYPGTPPELIRRNIERIRSLNPGWEYRFYGDAEVAAFIQAEFGERMFECFERIDPRYGAARADLFRYLLLYKVGGVYLDIKSGMRRPLDEVLRPDDRYLLSHWDAESGFSGWGKHRELEDYGGRELVQWFIVAAPGHPFLHAVVSAVCANIESYNPIRDGTGRLAVLRLTGPIAYTRAIMPLVGRYPHRFVSSEKDLGLFYSVFSEKPGPAHKGIFKHHYSTLTEPVVVPTGRMRQWWPIYRPVQNGLILPMRRVADAVSRRLGTQRA